MSSIVLRLFLNTYNSSIAKDYRCYRCGTRLSYSDEHMILIGERYHHVGNEITKILYERIHICETCYTALREFFKKTPQTIFTQRVK